ncbi:MAG: alpha-ketoacid dehydrogenase subunit beta [Gemmobacter sp.]
MTEKTWMYAVLEAVQAEMRSDPAMTWFFELTPPVASSPGRPVINLETEFGRKRVVNTGIDEMWMVAAVTGAGLAGSRSATYIPYQGIGMTFQILQNHAGKLRHMTGGKASIPVVYVMEFTGQTPGFAGQHSDYEMDTTFAHMVGIRTVVPSTPYDAKGMMHAALRSPDPVVFIYPAGLRMLMEDVPDEPYEVPLDKAAIRTEGGDITIVSSGPGMQIALEAAKRLQDEGVGVETIDLRVLKEMDTETFVNSVAKTRRLLTVDMSYYTLCPGAEVIARTAENVDGARYKRVAFPDAPPPASPEMFLWMRPNADHVYDAARRLIG